jgi:Na+/H+ antiporter NhaC
LARQRTGTGPAATGTGVYVTGSLGVPVTSYAPWAVANWAAVFILALFGYTGFKMAPKVRDDETRAGS